jgi:hypothetical protein
MALAGAAVAKNAAGGVLNDKERRLMKLKLKTSAYDYTGKNSTAGETTAVTSDYWKQKQQQEQEGRKEAEAAPPPAAASRPAGPAPQGVLAYASVEHASVVQAQAPFTPGSPCGAVVAVCFPWCNGGMVSAQVAVPQGYACGWSFAACLLALWVPAGCGSSVWVSPPGWG